MGEAKNSFICLIKFLKGSLFMETVDIPMILE